MTQKFNICFIGSTPELLAERLYLLLSKICKGNTEKVDEILDVPGAIAVVALGIGYLTDGDQVKQWGQKTKLARIALALLRHGGCYQVDHVAV